MKFLVDSSLGRLSTWLRILGYDTVYWRGEADRVDEELHVDDNQWLHREDGPAVVYRDGWRVYAWHGLAVPEDWILHPEAIPPAKLRGFDASFRRFAESRRHTLLVVKARPNDGTVLARKAPRPDVPEDGWSVLVVDTELVSVGSTVARCAAAVTATEDSTRQPSMIFMP